MSQVDLKSDLNQIGDYHIIKQIAEEIQGKVYLAEHRFLKKKFILKMLSDEIASDRSFIERLEKQIAFLTLFDHPNIIKIHELCFLDEKYFIVTDCVFDSLNSIKSLSRYLNQNKLPLSEEEIIQVVEQISSALEYAHQKTLPQHCVAFNLDNILIEKIDDKIKVFLSDFGLTQIMGIEAFLNLNFKAVDEATVLKKYFALPVENLKLSKLHDIFQNYSFLAPEQKIIDDLSRDIDIKMHIYSLGILVYYLIASKFPEGFFPLPSQIRVELKHNWDLFIYRSLQLNPKNRTDSFKDLLESLNSKNDDVEKSKVFESDALFQNNRVNNKEQSSTSSRLVIKPQELVRPEYEPDPASVFHIDTNVVKYTPKQQEVQKNIKPIATEMKIIQGGNFLRGSNHGARDEMPRHVVHLNSFAFDIHPVTNEQFVRFLEALGGEKDVNNCEIIRLRESRIKRTAGKLSIESGYSKHPVIGVTWYGAVAYAKWVGKRLPTEAEWEVAAYGGLENAQYPTGDNIERSQANFFSSDTTTVMSYPPNSYGLYDMSGNVYEWCEDWYGYNYYDISIQEPDNPKGPLQGVYRVLRGGCWKSLKEDMRCAHRHRNNPGVMNRTYGFRCAADVEVID